MPSTSTTNSLGLAVALAAGAAAPNALANDQGRNNPFSPSTLYDGPATSSKTIAGDLRTPPKDYYMAPPSSGYGALGGAGAEQSPSRSSPVFMAQATVPPPTPAAPAFTPAPAPTGPVPTVPTYAIPTSTVPGKQVIDDHLVQLTGERGKQKMFVINGVQQALPSEVRAYTDIQGRGELHSIEITPKGSGTKTDMVFRITDTDGNPITADIQLKKGGVAKYTFKLPDSGDCLITVGTDMTQLRVREKASYTMTVLPVAGKDGIIPRHEVLAAPGAPAPTPAGATRVVDLNTVPQGAINSTPAQVVIPQQDQAGPDQHHAPAKGAKPQKNSRGSNW